MLHNLSKLSWLILFTLLLTSMFSYNASYAQYFDLQPHQKHQTIPFRLIRNMIVIKIKINDKGPFNFILDTGAGLMLITEPDLVDSIDIRSKRMVKIPGLGQGEDAEAYITTVLNIQIPGLQSFGINAAILKKEHFNLSNYAGIPVSGLIGYEFFSNLAVTLNFSDSTIRVCRPANLRSFKRKNKIPITIEDRKPYLHALVTYPNGKKTDVKLIIDLGAGHPLSVDNMLKDYGFPQKCILANLGIGLNGPINGYLSRVNEIELGKYTIKNILASFPDSSKQKIVTSIPRDGNLGIGILKKFTVIIDYPDSVLYLKAGSFFKEPFEHDMSGLEYYCSDDFKHVIISRVEPGSASDMVGLEKGDEIVTVNLKPVAKMSLEEIDALFKSRDGRSILLEIYHDKKYDNVVLTLKRRI